MYNITKTLTLYLEKKTLTALPRKKETYDQRTEQYYYRTVKKGKALTEFSIKL